MSRFFRILACPLGEAPEWVRHAWIGIILPKSPGIQNGNHAGVLTGNEIREGSYEGGFSVVANVAVAILEQIDIDASDWWSENAKDFLEEGGIFAFDDAACENV